MAFNELAERIRKGLARRKNIEEKRMFGVIGFLVNGNKLVGVWKESLIVRLGPIDGDEALKEPHVREFDITRRAMKGWVLVDPEGIEGKDDLSGWIQRAIKFVGNPFRPVRNASSLPTARDGAVRKLAQQIYDTCAFKNLSTLADTLVEVGYDNADLLAHCQEPGPHVKECLSVDLLLGKK
jgi:hypothetical protein